MKTIAYASPFVPPEWIAAHRLRPLRLYPRIADGRSFVAVARGRCPFASAVAEMGLADSEASALVLTTACDQMRYAAGLLEMDGRYPFFLLNAPSTWQTTSAAELYGEELRRLGRFLVALGGQTPDAATLSETMLAHAAERKATGRRLLVDGEHTGIPLAVLGGPLWESDDTFFDLIERVGGCVVLDGTEGGERTLPRPFDPAAVASDPFAELADAYFDGIPDPFRRPNSGFYEWLARELSSRRVRGIVFYRYVWCDLWHAELPRVRQQSGLPVLEIDVGPDGTCEYDRAQGRIEAFLETLR